MARITVEDCQERVDNRFLLVQMTIKRVYQYREGYESLVDTRNKEVVTALREIAAGKILPEDRSYFTPSDGTKRHIAGYDSDSYETDDYIVEVPDISAANARLAQAQAMDLAAYDKAADEADDDDSSNGGAAFMEVYVDDSDDTGSSFDDGSLADASRDTYAASVAHDSEQALGSEFAPQSPSRFPEDDIFSDSLGTRIDSYGADADNDDDSEDRF